MEYGYARVSSTEQNLDRQILALQKYVEPKNIVTDKQSGKNLDRPGYNALKGIFGLRPGDVLYIVSLDRLSRNKEDIKNEIAWFKAHKVRLMIRKRQREGIEAAKKKGKHLGRPYLKVPDNFEEVYAEWKSGVITARAAQKKLGMSSASFYRLVKKQQADESKGV